MFINYARVSWPDLYYCMLDWICMDYSTVYQVTCTFKTSMYNYSYLIRSTTSSYNVFQTLWRFWHQNWSHFRNDVACVRQNAITKPKAFIGNPKRYPKCDIRSLKNRLIMFWEVVWCSKKGSYWNPKQLSDMSFGAFRICCGRLT